MMDAQAVTLRGRLAAESLMIDTCRVERATGEVTDPETGVVTDGWETVYSGKFKLAGNQAQATAPQAGGHAFTVEQVMVHLPVSSKCQVDDRVTITEAVLDPDLVGLQLRLNDMTPGAYRTADRWNVELVTG